MLATLLQSALATTAAPTVPADVGARIGALGRQLDELRVEFDALLHAAGMASDAPGRLQIFHGYMGVFIIAFLTTLLATPLMRRLALANGIVDRPLEARKIHKTPTAYLGGVAVYLGILFGILFTYTAPWHGMVTFHSSTHDAGALPGGVSIWIVIGMTVIMACGLIDDVMGIHPRAKIAGMLFAAAALATQNIGVRVAAGVMIPAARALGIETTIVGGEETLLLLIPIPGGTMFSVDLVYWVGTAVIAVFVLGACNASNLIDGLDGLLSGTTAIANAGLLVVALGLAARDDGVLDAPRIVLCLGVLGACLGFLPHNFNPASIFLGDAGSLLLGFCTIVIVLTLGDTGRTDLVLAGLIIYAIPIIDTCLAIVRRKLAGKRISDADDQHLHHMLKRALGVKGAVLSLYAIAAGFALLGIGLSDGKARVTYALTLVFAAFIGVTAFKIAGRNAEAARTAAPEPSRSPSAEGDKPGTSPPPATPARPA